VAVSTPYEKTGEISCSENLTGCGQSIREVTRMTNKGGAESGLVLLVHGLELGRGVRVALEFSQEVQADDQQLDGGAG